MDSNYPDHPHDEGLYQQASGSGSTSENFKVHELPQILNFRRKTEVISELSHCRWSFAYGLHYLGSCVGLACDHTSVLPLWSRANVMSSFRRIWRCGYGVGTTVAVP